MSKISSIAQGFKNAGITYISLDTRGYCSAIQKDKSTLKSINEFVRNEILNKLSDSDYSKNDLIEINNGYVEVIKKVQEKFYKWPCLGLIPRLFDRYILNYLFHMGYTAQIKKAILQIKIFEEELEKQKIYPKSLIIQTIGKTQKDNLHAAEKSFMNSQKHYLEGIESNNINPQFKKDAGRTTFNIKITDMTSKKEFKHSEQKASGDNYQNRLDFINKAINNSDEESLLIQTILSQDTAIACNTHFSSKFLDIETSIVTPTDYNAFSGKEVDIPYTLQDVENHNFEIKIFRHKDDKIDRIFVSYESPLNLIKKESFESKDKDKIIKEKAVTGYLTFNVKLKEKEVSSVDESNEKKMKMEKTLVFDDVEVMHICNF